MNIQFVELSTYGDDVYLPYVYGCLRSHLETYHSDTAKHLQWLEPIYIFPENILGLKARFEKADILCVSCYIWNTEKAMSLARYAKIVNPKINIIAGGPSVPRQIGDFFTRFPFVDMCVHGEGEEVFAQIIERFLTKNTEFSDLPISTKENPEYQKSTILRTDLEHKPYPSPFLQGYFDKMIRDIKSAHRSIMVVWETNRGCPYGCTFCDWGSATLSKLRKIESDRLFQELEWFGKKQIDSIYIADSNFGILPRDQDLARGLVRMRETYGSPRSVLYSSAKSVEDSIYNIHKILSKYSLGRGTLASVQSMNPNTLMAIKRRNPDIKKIQKLREQEHDLSVPITTDIIVGLPLETNQSFLNGLAELLENDNHTKIKILPLCILPNAPMNDPLYKAKYKLEAVSTRLSSNVDINDSDPERIDVVVSNSTMTQEDWLWRMTLGTFVQAFVNGGLLKYILIYLVRTGHVTHKQWLSDLMSYSEKSQGLLGRLYQMSQEMYKVMIDNPDSNYQLWENISVVNGEPVPKLRMTPHQRVWLEANLKAQVFYREISDFCSSHYSINVESELWIELCKFQWESVYQKGDLSRQGQASTFKRNWVDFFKNPKRSQVSEQKIDVVIVTDDYSVRTPFDPDSVLDLHFRRMRLHGFGGEYLVHSMKVFDTSTQHNLDTSPAF